MNASMLTAPVREELQKDQFDGKGHAVLMVAIRLPQIEAVAGLMGRTSASLKPAVRDFDRVC
ncbi:MAG: hypothetical protein ACO3FE_00865 [Planctomycetaceae bacterium]